jgi:hypothetical protein
MILLYNHILGVIKYVIHIIQTNIFDGLIFNAPDSSLLTRRSHRPRYYLSYDDYTKVPEAANERHRHSEST